MNIAQNIRKIREQKRLTQRELAEKCGWKSPSTVSNYESGDRSPDFQDLQKIATALQVDITALIKGIYVEAANQCEESDIVDLKRKVKRLEMIVDKLLEKQ